MLTEGEKYRYVCIKIKPFDLDSVVGSKSLSSSKQHYMVQILDMSHKMFYTEIKERESIL